MRGLESGVDLEKSSLILLSSCLFLNLISGTINGLRSILPVWLHESNMQNPGFYKTIFYVANFSLSVAAVLIGFLIGRRGAEERKHHDYAVALLVGGALAPVLLGLVSLVSADDTIRTVTQVGSATVLGRVVGFTGKIYTGLALAWLYRGAPLKPGWVTRIVQLVALIQVWRVSAAVVRAVQFRRMMAGVISAGGLGSYVAALSLVGVLVSLVYFYYLYGAGKAIDMKQRYADVLYSLLVPMVLGGVMVDIIGLYGHGAAVQDMITSVVWEVVGSTIGVFGTEFAVVSYAYFRGKGGLSGAVSHEL